MDIESAVVETEGQQWQKDLPDLGDLEVLVAPWDNATFERLQQKLIRALPAALRADGQVEPKSFYIINGKCIARTILFGWKNFTLGGIEKPFDAIYAESILVDPKYRPFRDGVVAAARRVQLGAKADEEAIVETQTTSAGSATGAVKSSA